MITWRNASAVLYLVFHGEPGWISLSNEVSFSLEELAGIMGDRFNRKPSRGTRRP
jgi:hypothetical protein